MYLTTAKSGWKTRLAQIPGTASGVLGPQISAQECATQSARSLLDGVLHQSRIHRQRPSLWLPTLQPTLGPPSPGGGRPAALPPARALGPQGRWPPRRLPVQGPALPSVGLAVPQGGLRPCARSLCTWGFQNGPLCAGRVLGMCWQTKQTSPLSS